MKIAVAFFGIPRITEQCYPSIQKHILNSLPKNAEVKCFYHLYKQKMVINPRSKEEGKLSDEAYTPFMQYKGVLSPPNECLEKWNFDDIKAHGDRWKDNFASLRNLIHQLNSLYEVTQLIKPFDPDFVLYIRPDLLYHDNIPKSSLRFLQKNKNCCFIPAWMWFKGLNDRFSICNRESYTAYGERILVIEEFLKEKSASLHGEELLRFALEKNGTLIMPLTVRASRLRIGGHMRKEKFSIFKRTGGFKSYSRLILKKILLYFY